MPRKAHCTVVAGRSEGLCTPDHYQPDGWLWFAPGSAAPLVGAVLGCVVSQSSPKAHLFDIPPCRANRHSYMAISCNLGRKSPLELTKILKSEGNSKLKIMSLPRDQAPSCLWRQPQLACGSCVQIWSNVRQVLSLRRQDTPPADLAPSSIIGSGAHLPLQMQKPRLRERRDF